MPEPLERDLGHDRDRGRVEELLHVGPGERGAHDDAAGPVDDEPAALVDAALRRMNEGWPQPSESEARELDVVRVMLDGSDDLRRACILELAARSTDGRYLRELADLFERGARVKAPSIRGEQAEWYAAASIVSLLSVLARKRLRLSGAEVERLLDLLWRAETAPHYRSTAVRALSRQIEHAHAELSRPSGHGSHRRSVASRTRTGTRRPSRA